MSEKEISRRGFIKSISITTAISPLLLSTAQNKAIKQKARIGIVGVGNRGHLLDAGRINFCIRSPRIHYIERM